MSKGHIRRHFGASHRDAISIDLLYLVILRLDILQTHRQCLLQQFQLGLVQLHLRFGSLLCCWLFLLWGHCHLVFRELVLGQFQEFIEAGTDLRLVRKKIVASAA